MEPGTPRHYRAPAGWRSERPRRDPAGEVNPAAGNKGSQCDAPRTPPIQRGRGACDRGDAIRLRTPSTPPDLSPDPPAAPAGSRRRGGRGVSPQGERHALPLRQPGEKGGAGGEGDLSTALLHHRPHEALARPFRRTPLNRQAGHRRSVTGRTNLDEIPTSRRRGPAAVPQNVTHQDTSTRRKENPALPSEQ